MLLVNLSPASLIQHLFYKWDSYTHSHKHKHRGGKIENKRKNGLPSIFQVTTRATIGPEWMQVPGSSCLSQTQTQVMLCCFSQSSGRKPDQSVAAETETTPMLDTSTAGSAIILLPRTQPHNSRLLRKHIVCPKLSVNSGSNRMLIYLITVLHRLPQKAVLAPVNSEMDNYENNHII